MKLETGEIVQVVNFLMCPEEFPFLYEVYSNYYTTVKKINSIEKEAISIPRSFDGLKLIYLGESCRYEDSFSLRILHPSGPEEVYMKTVPSFLLIRNCGRILNSSLFSVLQRGILYEATKEISNRVIKRQSTRLTEILEADKDFVVRNEMLDFTEGLTVSETLNQMIKWCNKDSLFICPKCKGKHGSDWIIANHYISPEHNRILSKCRCCKAVLALIASEHIGNEPYQIELVEIPVPSSDTSNTIPF